MTVRWNGDDVFRRARQGATVGVIAATALVEEESVRRIVEDPKTGIIYQRGDRVHQASAPGEAPASDTGRLIASRNVEIEDEAPVGRVSYNTEYARALEMGNEKIAPRPYLRVSLESKSDEVGGTINQFIRDAVGR